MHSRYFGGGALIGALALTAHADVLDGSRAGDLYGAALAVQTVQTQFGDNLSELNAGYATAQAGGMLRLMLTGQVEANFNKLNVFIDSVAGGQNRIGPDINNGGVNPINDGLAAKYSGFTFDTGFAADFALIARNGFSEFALDFMSIGNNSVSESSVDIFGGSLTGTNASVGPSGIGVGYDNSNTAGVIGGTGAANQAAAAAVLTGLELWIPMSAIGNPSIGDTILISAHINGSNHDFLSNQSLAGFAAPQGNLGGDGFGNFTGNVSLIDLNQFAGIQFFRVQVVPAPSTLGLILLAGAGYIRRRR